MSISLLLEPNQNKTPFDVFCDSLTCNTLNAGTSNISNLVITTLTATDVTVTNNLNVFEDTQVRTLTFSPIAVNLIGEQSIWLQTPLSNIRRGTTNVLVESAPSSIANSVSKWSDVDNGLLLDSDLLIDVSNNLIMNNHNINGFNILNTNSPEPNRLFAMNLSAEPVILASGTTNLGFTNFMGTCMTISSPAAFTAFQAGFYMINVTIYMTCTIAAASRINLSVLIGGLRFGSQTVNLAIAGTAFCSSTAFLYLVPADFIQFQMEISLGVASGTLDTGRFQIVRLF